MNAWITLAQQSPPAADDAWLVAGFALFGAALLLFALEFVIPSGGLVSTLCVLAVASGVFCFFMHSATWGMASLVSALAAAPIAIGYGLKLWAHSPMARRVVLSQAIEERADSAGTGHVGVAVGTVARTETPLRPVGWIRAAGHRHEALAEEGFIDAGAAVRVVGRNGATLRVRRDDAPPAA
jgi:membrane-bound serine protease (ClpP class)